MEYHKEDFKGLGTDKEFTQLIEREKARERLQDRKLELEWEGEVIHDCLTNQDFTKIGLTNNDHNAYYIEYSKLLIVKNRHELTELLPKIEELKADTVKFFEAVGGDSTVEECSAFDCEYTEIEQEEFNRRVEKQNKAGLLKENNYKEKFRIQLRDILDVKHTT